MGNTGNSDTYPYGLRSTTQVDQVYNRVTGETVAEYPRFTSKASKKINALVADFKAASPEEQKVILGEAKVAA